MLLLNIWLFLMNNLINELVNFFSTNQLTFSCSSKYNYSRMTDIFRWFIMSLFGLQQSELQACFINIFDFINILKYWRASVNTDKTSIFFFPAVMRLCTNHKLISVIQIGCWIFAVQESVRHQMIGLYLTQAAPQHMLMENGLSSH